MLEKSCQTFSTTTTEMDEYIMRSYIFRSMKRRPIIMFTLCAILLWLLVVTYAAVRTFEIEVPIKTMLGPKTGLQSRQRNALNEQDKLFDEQQRNLLIHEFYHHMKHHLSDVDGNFTDQYKTLLMYWKDAQNMTLDEKKIKSEINQHAIREDRKHKRILKDWIDQDIAMRHKIKNLNLHRRDEAENIETRRMLKPKFLVENERRQKIIHENKLKTNTSLVAGKNVLKTITDNKYKKQGQVTNTAQNLHPSLPVADLELDTDEKLNYTSESYTSKLSYDKSIPKILQSEIGPISEYTDIVYNTDHTKQRNKIVYSLPYYEKYFLLENTDRTDRLLTETVDETHQEIGPISEYVDVRREDDDVRHRDENDVQRRKEVNENMDWMQVFGRTKFHHPDNFAEAVNFYWEAAEND